MSKSSKLYKDSPALERDGDGNMQAVRPSEKSDGAGAGEDGSDAEMQNGGSDNATHAEERASMHSRHESELKDMHKRHQKDAEEMHKRHEGKKDKK